MPWRVRGVGSSYCISTTRCVAFFGSVKFTWSRSCSHHVFARAVKSTSNWWTCQLLCGQCQFGQFCCPGPLYLNLTPIISPNQSIWFAATMFPLQIRKQPADKHVASCRMSSSWFDHFTEKETETENWTKKLCLWIGSLSVMQFIFKKVSKLKSRQMLCAVWKLNDFTFLPTPHQACVVNFQPLWQLHSSVHKSASQPNPNQNITALSPVGATWDAF